jgi:hypothetical protein
LDWRTARALVLALVERPGKVEPAVGRLVRRLTSRGCRRRLELIARSSEALPVSVIAPGLRTIVCWTGGYVAPFLIRLRRHLPEPRYRLVPMYAMSTETIETVPDFGRLGANDVAFLPLAPGVHAEFLEEDEELAGTERADGEPSSAANDPARLLPPWGLIPGRTYALVVSDVWGLRRYQTGDLFRCKRLVHDLPDLHFVRRRGLEYSFTGEKLTGHHAAAAFERTRQEVPGLGEDTFLALVPSHPLDEPIPHYRLLVAVPGQPVEPDVLHRTAACVDAALSEANPEYRAKVSSNRLRPIRPCALSIPDLARLVGGDLHRGSWEAQVKFLPLYRRTLEELQAESRRRPGGNWAS